MLKKLLLALCFCMFTFSACAEISCVCMQEDCTCFIQLGDEGMAVEVIQNTLTSHGYLAPEDDASTYDENTRQAVICFQLANDLTPTGRMDDNTLTLLLWGMLPEALDEASPAISNSAMWIPTDGGIRYHDMSTCSKMYDPRLVALRNALALGMTPCGRCKPEGYQSK